MSFDVKTKVEWNGPDVKVRGRKVVGKTSYETGLVVEGQAKTLCAVDSGRLRGSITTQTRGMGTGTEAPAQASDKISAPGDDLETFVGTAVFYGPYVEFGTRRMDSQPFLRPALDLAKGQVLTIGKKNARFEFKDYLVRPA